MNALELRDLTRRYPDFTLDRLNLTLPSGCILGLIGENGAGKSTTIRLILDMIRRDAGSVTVFGKEVREAGASLREDLGVVLDEVGVPGCLNAKQVGKVMAGVFRRWDAGVYADYLKRLDIPENRRFEEFSRGMKMKLGIAVALSHSPKLLILDEATSGLDPLVRDEVTDLFSDFTRDEGRAVLISSHIVTDLEKICDYVAFLHKGRLLLCEEKDRLKERYGVLRCSAERLAELEPAAVLGKREGPYGTEAIVERDAVPSGTELGAMDIEQLFIFMAKSDLPPVKEEKES